MTRSTPITLMHRDHVSWLLPPLSDSPPVAPAESAGPHNALGSNARAAYDAFLRHGALFPAQLAALLQLMPSQVDDVLGELAAAGLVTSDGYPALRTLIGVRGNRIGRTRPRPHSSVRQAAAGRFCVCADGRHRRPKSEPPTGAVYCSAVMA